MEQIMITLAEAQRIDALRNRTSRL